MYKLEGEVEKIMRSHNYIEKHGWKVIGGAVRELTRSAHVVSSLHTWIACDEHESLYEPDSLGKTTIDDILVNSEMELMTRISIAAATIRETPGIFEYVRQTIPCRYHACIHANGSNFKHLLGCCKELFEVSAKLVIALPTPKGCRTRLNKWLAMSDEATTTRALRPSTLVPGVLYTSGFRWLQKKKSNELRSEKSSG
ncbi:hypothetical protein TNCV_1583931 [Trichonephila clavipes]|nr:hypothetical protein TNCV_1583931 [Trichonephila clavipes]